MSVGRQPKVSFLDKNSHRETAYGHGSHCPGRVFRSGAVIARQARSRAGCRQPLLFTGLTSLFLDGVFNGALYAADESLEGVKPLDALASLAAHPLALVWMGPEVFNGASQRGRIARRDKQAVDALLEHVALTVDARA